MKKKIIIAALLILSGYVIHAQTRPRFELMYHEHIAELDSSSNFYVYHDRESGVEFICSFRGVDLGHSVSCFSTGRNWK